MVLAAVTADAVNSWFTPFHYIVYLGVPLLLFIVYSIWKWDKDCKENVMVLAVNPDGSTNHKLVPKEGNTVTLKNPNKKEATGRVWPINKLSTIDVSYPGLAFIPAFLQRKIKEVIVDAEDWEPLLNRGSYNENVASPDVIDFIRNMAVSETLGVDTQKKLKAFADSLNAAPTRQMVASPAFLYNLINEKITEAVITVNKEMMDRMDAILKKMSNYLTPVHFWIGIGVVGILTGFIAYTVMNQANTIADLQSDINLIKTSLGVVAP